MYRRSQCFLTRPGLGHGKAACQLGRRARTPWRCRLPDETRVTRLCPQVLKVRYGASLLRLWSCGRKLVVHQWLIVVAQASASDILNAVELWKLVGG